MRPPPFAVRTLDALTWYYIDTGNDRTYLMAATYGLLSTHPPIRCGLTTFNAAPAAQLGVTGRSCWYEALAADLIAASATGRDRAVRAAGPRA